MSSSSLGMAACCGLALLASAPAAAQTPPTPGAGDGATIVVTAARIAQPLGEVLTDLRVIDRETIERAGAASLPELLRRHAGVEIAANGGPGQVSAVFLRGSNANHVVLLVDGVRVNSATTGTNAFEHLPLAAIERIEVLRAPASSLYGADAIGGVIQVFTRQGEGAQVTAGVGSRGSGRLDASVGARWGATRLSVFGGTDKTDGFSASLPEAGPWTHDPDDDGWRNRHAGFTLGHEVAPGHQLALRGTWSASRTDFDAGPGTADRNRQRLSTVALESRNRLADGWTSVLRAARGSDRIGTEGAYPGRFVTDQDQFGWQHEIDGAGARWVAGLEWRRERVDSTTAYTRDARIVRGAYLGASTNFGAQSVQGSLRHDDDAQFGGHATGQLAWGWQLTPGWRVAASVATAFKAPSFNDLYYPLEFGYSGNPDLRPEKSRGVELSARWAREGLGYGITAFDNRVRDLIAIDPSFTTVVNVARARIRGLTLDGRWQRPLWQAAAELTLQQPRDSDTGARLVRRAQRHGSASLSFTPGAWELGIEGVASGARFDRASNDPGSRLGGYALVNLSARWRLDPAWSVLARLDNAADRDYTLAQGYATAGRSAFVALEWRAR